MSKDIVQELGYLTLGTRLKRIGERMQADTQRVLESFDLTIPAGQWPFLAALEKYGPMTIGDLANVIGITQPGATRTVLQLVDAELVAVASSKDDQRRKTVSLTTKGERLVTTGKKTAWPVIEKAVRQLCHDLSGPLLDQLASIENGLDQKSLHARITRNPGSRK